MSNTLKEQVKSAHRDAAHLAGYVGELSGLISFDHPARPTLDEAITAANQAQRYAEIASQAFEQVDQQAVIAACQEGCKIYNRGMKAANGAALYLMKERRS